MLLTFCIPFQLLPFLHISIQYQYNFTQLFKIFLKYVENEKMLISTVTSLL